MRCLGVKKSIKPKGGTGPINLTRSSYAENRRSRSTSAATPSGRIVLLLAKRACYGVRLSLLFEIKDSIARILIGLVIIPSTSELDVEVDRKLPRQG